MNTTPAIDTLRAMYRTARSGAALDAPAYVDALLGAIADGEELHKIAGCFEKLGYHTRLDIIGHAEGGGSRVAAARKARGWKGAIRVASALGLTNLWCAAMTAHYGPSGTHQTRLDADGVPTAETLAEFPRIAEAMAEAAERFELLASWYDRRYAGQAPDMHYVVRYSAPAVAA